LKALGQKSDANLDAIVARLKDGDPTIRTAAVTVLGLIGGVKTANKVDVVINDTAAQASAIAALQAIGAPAVTDVAQNLNAPSDTVEFRLQLIDALGAIGTPNTLAPLKVWVLSDQPSLKREAIVELATIALTDGAALQTASAAAKIAAANPKSKPADIQTATSALNTAQTTFSQVVPLGPILVSALRDTTANSEVRSQSALALGYIGGADAVHALVSVLSDYDTQVRQAAVAGLQSAGSPAVSPLIAALSGSDSQARAGAAEALGGIGNAPAIAALNATFAEPGTPALVRRSAALGLGRSGSPAVIPTLVRALADPNGDVQSAASDALLSPALSVPAVAPLIASFTRPTPVPFNASQTLSRMGNQAVPQLEAAIRTANPLTQTWAAVTLGQTDSKDPGIQSALKPLMASANPEVKFAASQAVSRLAGS
jgi:HEAT repeat protein